MEELLEKIRARKAKVGIMGLGYVGLPLALSFAKVFTVVGYEPNVSIVDRLRRGNSHIMDVADQELQARLNQGFSPSCQKSDVADCDFILMCVPTPLIHEKEPDLSYIKNCTKMIAGFLHRGQFIILESTTYPGTTQEVVVPILEQSGLKVGIDFGAAYSQERIDPGNRCYRLENVAKVVGGITPECTDIAAALYQSIISSVIKVRDCKTAEACKILENVFRSVNIALINEMALIFEKMGIDVWEVVDAAATKPYGFMPFYPGPGIGGHCIPLDPYYLAYKARRCGVIPRFIELSGEINDFMKIHAVNLVEKGLAAVGRGISESQIAVLGLAYKKGIDDTRESPAKRIIDELVGLGARVKIYDPYVSKMDTRLCCYESAGSLEEAVSQADCALFVVDHDQFKRADMASLKRLMRNPVIVDCKNVFGVTEIEGFVYLAIGKPDYNKVSADALLVQGGKCSG